MFPWQCCFSNSNAFNLFILRLLDTYVPKNCKNIEKPSLHIVEILLVYNFSSFGVNYVSKQEKNRYYHF